MSAALPLSGPLLHKTPVLHRADPIHRVKMPSECYDSDDMDDILTSPSPSPLQKEKALVAAPEKKCKVCFERLKCNVKFESADNFLTKTYVVLVLLYCYKIVLHNFLF